MIKEALQKVKRWWMCQPNPPANCGHKWLVSSKMTFSRGMFGHFILSWKAECPECGVSLYYLYSFVDDKCHWVPIMYPPKDWHTYKVPTCQELRMDQALG